MPNPATVNKTLTITMLSLAAGKVPGDDPAARAAAIAARKAAQSVTGKTPAKKSPLMPKAPAAALVVPAQTLPAAKDGFYLMLAAGDGSRSYGMKMLQLCDGKLSTDRGATDLGAIPDSLTAAIATLQSEVAALVTSLTGSNKLSF